MLHILVIDQNAAVQQPVTEAYDQRTINYNGALIACLMREVKYLKHIIIYVWYRMYGTTI